MKPFATFCLAGLLITVAVFWFAGPKHQTDAPQPASSDASARTDGSSEPKGQGLGQGSDPSAEPNGSTARSDIGSLSPIPSADTDLTVSVPTEKLASAAGTAKAERITLDRAKEAFEGREQERTSAEPSDIDREACEAAAKTLRESLSIFDVTPTLAIWYSRGRLSDPLNPASGFAMLKQKLLAGLCSGAIPFDTAYPVESQFVAVSTSSHARILLGNHWISDGTILSPLSESQYALLTESFMKRRLTPAGQNMARDSFERQLAENPQSLITGP